MKAINALGCERVTLVVNVGIPARDLLRKCS